MPLQGVTWPCRSCRVIDTGGGAAAVVTVIFTSLPAGAAAFSCAETDVSGAARPFTVADTPPRVNGRGISEALATVLDRPVPYTEIIIPGLPVVWVVKALAMPAMLIPVVLGPRVNIMGTLMNCGLDAGD